MSARTGFIRNFVCPHCGVLSQFSTSMWDQDQSKTVYTISKCLNEECHRDSIFVYETNEPVGRINPQTSQVKLIYHYPMAKIQTHQAIPSNISDSYKEGVIDLNTNSHKSAVLMFRRALQEICKNKNADPNKKLNEQIDSVLNAELVQVAHEIRLWGNISAHPDDIIQSVQPNDAIQIKEFLEMVFEYTYILPWKIQQSQAKRSGSP